jgi:hypothetical protein
VYSSGLSLAAVEAGEVNAKQSRSSQSRSVDGYKLFGKALNLTFGVSIPFVILLLHKLLMPYRYLPTVGDTCVIHLVCNQLVHHRENLMSYTGRFIMFSVITNIYNKKTKGPTLMELFTATRKLKKFFFLN